MDNKRGLRGTQLSPKKQREYDALARGARGESRFPRLRESLGLKDKSLERERDLERQEREMEEQGFTSYKAPISGGVDMEKIYMMDPKYRARREAERMRNIQMSEIDNFEPSRSEVEQFMRERQIRPDINESEEQIYNRIKEMMKRER